MLAVLLTMDFADAQVELLTYYDGNVFTAKKIYSQSNSFIFQCSSPILFSSLLEKVTSSGGKKESHDQDNKERIDPVEVLIKKTYFEPSEIKVKIGQLVIWKNERLKLQALLMGMREIQEMKSGFIEPGKTFSWNFSKPGKYVYVDAIVIGLAGKIVVE